MDFASLKANVVSAMGRTDIPSYVYDLATSTINSEFRLLEMQDETTLSASSETVTLPADFNEIESVYIDAGGSRTMLIPTTEQGQAIGHDSSGRPFYYAIHNGEMTLMPVPDGTYTITLRYYTNLADLALDADTNAVLTRYPALYLYLALGHAAVWAKDDQSAVMYAQIFEGERKRAIKADTQRRLGPTLMPRNMRRF